MASPSILISNEPTFVSCTFTKEHGPIIIHAKEKETEASSASASASPAAPSVEVDSNYHARNIIRSDVPDILSLSLIRIHALAAIIENDEHNCGDKDPEMIDVTPFEIRMFDKRYGDGDGDGDGDRATGTVPTRTGVTDQQMQLLDIVSQMDMDGLSERLMDASMSAKIKLNGFANQNDDSNGNTAIDIDIDIDNDNDIDSGPTRTGTNGNGKEKQQELDPQGGGGELQNFLIRCDAIVQEFISAVHQQKQKMNRMRSNSGKSKSKRNRQGEGMGAGAGEGEGEGDSEKDMTMSFQNFTVNYFDALNRQCLHVDGILKEEEFANANTEREKNATNRIELNDELTQITIFYHDRSDRCHELIGNIPLTFPSNGPSWIYDLPIPFEPKWVRGNSTLVTVPTVSANDNGNANGDGAGGDANTRMTRMLPSSGLSAVVQEFIDIISNYQTLWDDLDDIDSNAWVLEPSLPARRSCLERRLALRSGGLSLHIVLDVDHVHVRSAPLTARFIGSSDEMSGLRSAYQRYISLDEGASESMDMVVDANLDVDDIDINIKGSNNNGNNGTLGEKGEISCWSEQLSIRDNLERCFGFPLPSPATTEKTDYIVECGVCYAHRISIGDDDDDDDDDGSKTIIPDIVCSNTKCGRSYHESCLSEWLHSIPGAKTSFGRIFGQCPYCCETISVKTATGNNNL